MPAETLEKARLSGPGPGGPGGEEGSGNGGRSGDGLVGNPARFGLWAFLGTATMLFIGFTSALLVRRASADWRPIAPPSLLWLNTALLLLSSVTLERARRRLRGWALTEAQRLVATTGLLGLLFLAGQVAAWRQLAAQGVFLASNPSSSFFYMLTAVHGLHVVGGLFWFVAIFARLRRLTLTPGEDGLSLFATYWHFLGVVWLYLLLLLFVV